MSCAKTSSGCAKCWSGPELTMYWLRKKLLCHELIGQRPSTKDLPMKRRHAGQIGLARNRGHALLFLHAAPAPGNPMRHVA